MNIDGLRVDGVVITPTHEDYDSARQIFVGGFDPRPAVIVRVQHAADVQAVVGFARDGGHDLAVRAGGHSALAHCSVDGGVVIDVRDLTTLDFDGDTVWAGAGHTAAGFTTAAAERDVAVGFGDTGSVGIAGITLGGGVGLLVRKHGMTIDSVEAFELVTADGRLLEVDRDREPDLFWALRGGGGNFGTVTRIRYRTVPMAQIYGGMLFQPATPEAVEGSMVLAAEAPEELSTIVNVMTAPPIPFLPADLVGAPIIMSLIVYAGAPEAGEAAVAPFRALAEPLADMVRPIRYPEMYPPAEEGYRPTAATYNGFCGPISAADAEAIVERIQQPAGMMQAVQLRVLGGAMARVAPEATAFAHRTEHAMVNVASIYSEEADEIASQSWVDTTVDTLGLRGGSAYVNFLGDEPNGLARAYPPATLKRLTEVKRRYDPDDLFRHNHTIPL